MSRAPRYLGLDIGTHTGYAIVEGNKLVASGVRDFSVKAHRHIGHRGIMFYDFLRQVGRVDEIYYEKVQFTGNRFSSDGGELYKGFLMLVNMYAAGYNIPTFGIWPTTLKKNFAGSGKADKLAMCAQARSLGWKSGKENTDLYHDEVDAIALLHSELRIRYGLKIDVAQPLNAMIS